ncbi:MAG: hypothetical protein GQ557_00180 [Mycoplasmataceae bacterium]|nr:hypothetical protein [Mycoplasmataceae bacterium]
MIKILVMCNWGNSSGLLARALTRAYSDITSEERGIKNNKLEDPKDWDMVIIAPHIKNQLEMLEMYFTPIPVVIPSSLAYYSSNVKQIRKLIDQTLKEGK